MKKIFIFLLLCINYNILAMQEEDRLALINHGLRMMALQKSELEPTFAWLLPKVEALTKIPDINAADDLGNTRMHYAALLGMVPEMISSINLGADPTIINAQGQDPLMVLDNVIIKEVDTLRRQSLINEYHILLRALTKKSTPQLRNTLLFRAIAAEDIKVVQKLLDAGADPNTRNDWGETPLHYAIQHVEGPLNKPIVDALIKKGARPDIAQSEGKTPLHLLIEKYFAFKHKNSSNVNLELINLMERLFTLSKDKNPQDKMGNTPLYLLVAGSLDTVVHDKIYILIKAMLKHGANPNIQNKNGFTPLHAAVLQYDAEVVTLLLDHGANPFISTFKPRTQKQIQEKALPTADKTPLEIAIELRNTPDTPLMPLVKIETMLKKAQKVPPAVQPKLEEAKPAAAALIKELEPLTKKLQEIQNTQ